MQGMSERQYAAHAGLSRGALQKAQTAERLVLFADGSINADASDARRAETTDPSKTRKPPAPKLKPVPEAAVAAVGDTLREQGLAVPAVGGGTTFLQAKTANEVLKAQERRISNDPKVAVTRGATWDNKANMPESFIKEIEDKYAGTRLGRQELEGEILDDVPGSLWSREQLDTYRLREAPEDLERVIVSVDPATSNEENSDETGIVVVGFSRDADGYARGYVLEDGSMKGKPEEWAKKAVTLYRKWEADKIVAEKNQGGDMVSAVIRAVDRSIPLKLVHASRGKVVRAEPISALYEQGRVHHVGRFDKLEDQMCLFSIDNIRSPAMGSPDRVDALVWGLTEIFDKLTGRRRTPKESTPEYKLNPVRPGLEHTPTGWMAG